MKKLATVRKPRFRIGAHAGFEAFEGPHPALNRRFGTGSAWVHILVMVQRAVFTLCHGAYSERKKFFLTGGAFDAIRKGGLRSLNAPREHERTRTCAHVGPIQENRDILRVDPFSPALGAYLSSLRLDSPSRVHGGLACTAAVEQVQHPVLVKLSLRLII